MSAKKEGEDQDLAAKAAEAAENLYRLRDTYFPADENEKALLLRAEVNSALKIVDSIPPEQRESPLQRANYEFLRGRILNVLPEYLKGAEDHLSKAVKLNPSFTDAWLCLGNCFWKKGDLLSAKNCYLLSLEKGATKNILCDLSMLERLLAQDAETPEQMLKNSIKHAKEAVALDVKDGNSWYNLGNAYLTTYFLTGSWDIEKLPLSLKAYQNAFKDERMLPIPDLHFNYATVNKYLENYERALTGFEAAAQRDPNLNAYEEVLKIVNLLDLLDSSVQGVAKGHRIAGIAASLDRFAWNCSLRKTTINHLSEGPNKEVAVLGKVLFFANREKEIPLYYLLCDSEKNCFILSVFGVLAGAIKVGDLVTLLEPLFRAFDISWRDKVYAFKSIRVDFLGQFLVNGKPLPPNFAAHASVRVEHKP